MTAIPLTLSTGISQRFTEDTALSDSARELYGLFVEATSFSESISLGHLRETGREELLRAYLDAQQDNWDGEGALAADPASLKYAIHFLDLLPSFILNPDASVDPDGEMNLEWYSGPQSVFSVSIGRDGTLTYAGLFGASKSHGVEPFGDSIPTTVAGNIERAISGT